MANTPSENSTGYIFIKIMFDSRQCNTLSVIQPLHAARFRHKEIKYELK